MACGRVTPLSRARSIIRHMTWLIVLGVLGVAAALGLALVLGPGGTSRRAGRRRDGSDGAAYLPAMADGGGRSKSRGPDDDHRGGENGGEGGGESGSGDGGGND